MYSLVNVATLVRDLARHPQADVLADQLLRAFALDEAALAVLDELQVDDGAQARRRADVLHRDRNSPRALQLLRAARAVADDAGLAAYTAGVDLLERATLGSLADLRSFVRRDVLAAAWTGTDDLQVARWPRAVELVADGVAGVHADDPALARPWLDAVADLDVQPAASLWPDVVAAVRALPADAEISPAPAEWAPRMHDACWAVHLTGRERDAAVTQLHALQALLAVTGPCPPLRAVAMVVAATHARVVADVLDAQTHDAMTQPLFRLLP